MQILLVGPSLFMPWTLYTVRALRRLGQSITLFHESNLSLDRWTLNIGRRLATPVPGLVQQLDRWRARWMRQRDQQLIRLVGQLQPDLILVLWGKSWTKELWEEVRTISRARIATWWLDTPFRNSVRHFPHLFDHFFIFDRSYLTPLKERGARKVQFLPCACDETVYRPMTLTAAEKRRFESEIAFIAWYYPSRLSMVKTLQDFDLKVWGRGWTQPQVQRTLRKMKPNIFRGERYVNDLTSAKIYNATQIGLNVHGFHTEEGGLNSRTFDLLACGTFELTDFVPGMEELLTPGKEVAVYRSQEEARDRIAYYLRHPEERKRIAARGRERTLREHTYLHRMKTVLQAVTS